MFSEFLHHAQRLLDHREPYALAMVVNREVPSSGKPGDKAIITADGSLIGWVGGGCTRGIIIKEAQAAIGDGKPRVVRISPEEISPSRQGIMDYKMTCQSGGTVEVYIEPVLPRPQLVVVGKSAVAGALVRLAKAMDYQICVMAPGIDEGAFTGADRVAEQIDFSTLQLRDKSFIVVSTQGDGDEMALQAALPLEPQYLGFIASRKKANAVFQYLRDQGITTAQLQSIRTPAGIDINAKLPEEIALSILAEIVQQMRSEQMDQSARTQAAPSAPLHEDLFINPVCDVPVQKSTAKHVVEYGGVSVYFCCDGCKVTFEENPEKYLEKMAGS